MVTTTDRDLVEAAYLNHGGETSVWARLCCPLCDARTGKEDKRSSLSVNTETGYYQCWKCAAKGWVPSIGDGRPLRDSGLPPKTETQDAPVITPPQGFLPLSGHGLTAVATADARRYLTGRGLPPRVWEEVGIGCVLSGYYAGRVVVPVRDAAGVWRGWVARSWLPNPERKYLYPKGMVRRWAVFNSAALQVETSTPALVVEGVFDALPYWPDAVAVLGKPTRAHMDMLFSARRPVSIVLDGDAWRESWALAGKLRLAGRRAGFVRLPPGDDPATVPTESLRERVTTSIDDPL